jgi:hypothetical protein
MRKTRRPNEFIEPIEQKSPELSPNNWVPDRIDPRFEASPEVSPPFRRIGRLRIELLVPQRLPQWLASAQNLLVKREWAVAPEEVVWILPGWQPCELKAAPWLEQWQRAIKGTN